MVPGTITRILDYYERSPEYDHEAKRALEIFFECLEGALPTAEFSDAIDRLFFEWFVYDFKLASGRTPLAEYELKNPDQLSERELRQTLELGDSRYGLFEVSAVRKGLGMDLRDPFSGEVIAVAEHLGSLAMKAGDLICARICKLGPRFEIVGGLLNKLPMRLSASARAAWLGQKPFVTTPQQVWKMWYAPQPKKQQPNPDKPFDFLGSLSEARQKLEHALADNKLDSMITAKIVEEWIFTRTPHGRELAPLTMLLGLLPEESTSRQVEGLINAFYALYSVAPHESLGGLSPREKAKRFNRPFGSGGVTLHEMKVPPDGGFGKIEAAHAAMQASDQTLATKLFNEAFALYQKNSTTFREVYRFYANAATAYFAGGDVTGGLALLKIALELNPRYDFALDLKKRYVSGELDPLILRGAVALNGGTKRLRRKFAIAACLRYYEFLKGWKINFATTKITTSVRTYWSGVPGQPIGRNDPCPCGAKQKDGRIIKFKKCHGK